MRIYDLLDPVASIVTPTITLASLASSATAGRQSTAFTLVDAGSRVPASIDIDWLATLATGTLANDKSAYLFLARSTDGTNYEVGPPAVGATDAAFTFTNSPVGASALPTDLLFVGSITFNAQSEARRRRFRVIAPPPNGVLVVLNYCGIAFSGTANQHAIKIRKRFGEVS